jgi:hypothetical protein
VREGLVFTANVSVAFEFLSLDHVFLFIGTINSFNFIIKHYRLYAKFKFV